MSNPYKVLGVSENATDDEITTAYRKLAKKYHPDLNHGSKEAEDKMGEINAAYEEIKRIRQGGGQSAGYGSNQGSYSTGDRRTQLFNSAKVYIQARQFSQALNVLSSIDSSERNAEWFYLSAIANYGAGNRITALNHVKEAVSIEPNNYEYQNLLNIIQNGGRVSNMGHGNYGSVIDVSGLCTTLCCANLCCNFCNCCC